MFVLLNSMAIWMEIRKQMAIWMEMRKQTFALPRKWLWKKFISTFQFFLPKILRFVYKKWRKLIHCMVLLGRYLWSGSGQGCKNEHFSRWASDLSKDYGLVIILAIWYPSWCFGFNCLSKNDESRILNLSPRINFSF